MRRRTSTGGEEKRESPARVLRAGTEVEVRSDDEGFSGAWYEATVARSPSSSHRRSIAIVVYSSLLSDGSPSRPLEEAVPLAHVRPRPPRDSALGPFALHQPVDAFHHDGWWAGVVARVHPETGEAPEKYTVCFPNTREVVEFTPEEVRAHFQWLRGHWVEPDDKEEAETYFGVGAPVEVTRDKENYGASWFSGRVLKVIRKSIFFVGYENLKADDGQQLREIVDVQYIRPSPPRTDHVDIFDLRDEVEAFYGDRWRRGVISKVLSQSKFIVKSKYRPEQEMEFDHSKLRPRRDWDDNRWIPASPGPGKCRIPHNPLSDKSAVSHRRKQQSGKRLCSPIPLSISSDCGSEATEPHSVMTSNGKTAERSNLDQRDSNQVHKKLKKGKSLEDDMRLLDCMLMQRCSNTPNRKDRESDAAKDLAIDSPSQTREQCPSDSHSKERSALCSDDVRNSAQHPSTGKAKLNCLSVSLGNREFASHLNEKGSKVQAQTPNKNNLLFDQDVDDQILTVEREGFGGFRRPRSRATHHRTKKLVFRAPHRRTVVSNDARQDESEVAVTKKRGRPRKGVTIDGGNTLECMELEQYDGTSEPAVETADGKKDAELSIVLADILQEINNRGGKEMSPDKEMSPQFSPQVADTEGDLPANTITSTCQASPCCLSNSDPFLERIDPFSGGNTLGKHLHAKQLSYVISSSLNTIIKNVPSLDEFHEAGTEAEIQARLSPGNEDIAPICKEIPHDCSSSKEIISEKEIILADHPSPNESNIRKTTFPFMKKSPLWESIESMEVFGIMPQEPHFRQLEQFSEEFREGMAIGLMVTFANIVANISKLSIMDSQTSFDEMRKTLIPLESNGFDVQRVRLRIERLLEIKRNHIQSDLNKTESKGRISDLKDEKDGLDAVVNALNKAIIELEQNLKCFCEKRALVIMQGQSNDCEIAKLERDVQAVEEAALLSERKFDAVLATPW